MLKIPESVANATVKELREQYPKIADWFLGFDPDAKLADLWESKFTAMLRCDVVAAVRFKPEPEDTPAVQKAMKRFWNKVEAVSLAGAEPPKEMEF